MSESTLLPHFRFAHAGKSYKCFKRKPDRTAPYYIKVTRLNRVTREVEVHKQTLETNVREVAERKAKEFIELVWSDRPDRLERLAEWKVCSARKPVEAAAPSPATIGQIIKVYRAKGPLRQKGRRTVADNINSLRLVTREGLGDPEMAEGDVDALPADVWTAKCMRHFEEYRLGRVPAGNAETRQSALVSLNAYARSARSVLQERFRPWYTEDANLVLPDLSGFMNYELTAPKKEKKKKPARELLQKTFEAARDLKEADEPAYIAWLLAVYSLRRGEVQRCQIDWLKREVLEDDADFFAVGEECWVIRTDRGKSDRERVIPLPDHVAEEILRFHTSDAPKRDEADRAYILPAGRVFATGPRPNRGQHIVKRVNAWMRKQGWTTHKTLHEMRALFLRKARAEHGLDAARQLGGHADARTTENSYTGAGSLKGVIVEFPGLNHHGVTEGTEKARKV